MRAVARFVDRHRQYREEARLCWNSGHSPGDYVSQVEILAAVGAGEATHCRAARRTLDDRTDRIGLTATQSGQLVATAEDRPVFSQPRNRVGKSDGRTDVIEVPLVNAQSGLGEFGPTNWNWTSWPRSPERASSGNQPGPPEEASLPFTIVMVMPFLSYGTP